MSSGPLVDPAGATPSVNLYVSPTGSSSDACTAADPCDLSTALTQVEAGDTVLFTVSGTYTSVGEPSFTIPSSITGSAPVTLEASPGVSGVVLDGTAAETAGDSILTIDTSTSVVVDGLTFKDTDPSAATVGSGGAIDDPTASLTVENSTFTGNAASSVIGNGNGGAIDIGDADSSSPISLTVEGSTFTDNTAANHGGAIAVGDTASGGEVSVTIESSTFSNNTSSDRGGAIDVGDGATNGPISLTVESSTFSGNTAQNYGGAIDEANSATTPGDTASVSLDVEGSTFSDNTASGGSGGAIDAANGTTNSSGASVSATIEHSTFTATSPSDNVVVAWDGGLINLGDGNTVSSVTIDGSQFTTTSSDGGTVATNGAAIDIADTGGTASSVSIDSSQFTSTGTAQQAVAGFNGGAVDVADGGGTVSSVSIDSSRFTSTATIHNVAGNDGGAVDIADGGGNADTVSITDSTFTLQPGASSSGSAGQPVVGNDGGAVDVADNGTAGTVSIDSTKFLGTQGPVLTAQNSGGAVDIADQSSGQVTSSVSIQDVTATDLSAGYGGGAIAVLEQPATNSSAPISVDGSTFSRNRAVGNNGGALNVGTAGSAFTGPVTVSDSTFENNTAGSGGAIGTQSSAVTVKRSTFSDNISVGGNGGALDTGSNTTGPVSVTASTLVGQSDRSSYLVDGSGTFTLAGDILDGTCNQAGGTWDDQGWNATTDDSCTNGGSGDIRVSGLDALLASPADNGGSTQTVLPLAGNPAIGQIPNGTSVTVGGSSLALCPVAADQRGLPSTTGSACNAGAIQRTTQTVSIASTAPSDAVVGGGAYTPTATTSSALAASFSVDPASSLVCTVAGGSVSFFRAGTCTLVATQDGNAAWSAASASQSFAVGAAPSSPAGSGGSSTPPPTTVTPPAATLPPLPPTIPAGTFGTPSTGSASATSATTVTSTAGRASATAYVPADALPAGTTVSVTPVVNATAIAGVIPRGDAYVTSFAVSWKAPDGSAPRATAPITLTISDPSIVAGDVVYEVTATGSLHAVGVATTNGTVTITFSNDPDFVVAASPKLALAKKQALVTKQAVRVSLRCVKGSTCRGTASITITRVVTRNGKPVLKRGKKTYTHPVLAKASFTISKGRVATLKLTMTKLGRSLLVGKKRIARVTLRTAVTNGARTAQPLRLTY